jgi:hypothetical protein
MSPTQPSAKPVRKRATTSTSTAKRGTTAARPRARRRKPTHGEISERAYFIYLEEGTTDEFGNWMRAEHELMVA